VTPSRAVAGGHWLWWDTSASAEFRRLLDPSWSRHLQAMRHQGREEGCCPPCNAWEGGGRGGNDCQPSDAQYGC